MKEKSENQDSEKIDEKKQKKMKKKDRQNFEIHKHKSKKEDTRHTNIPDYQTNDTNDNSRDKNLVTQQMAINKELSESEKWISDNTQEKSENQDSEKINEKKQKKKKKEDRENFNIHKHKSKNEDIQDANISDYQNNDTNDNSRDKSLVTQQMAINEKLSESEKCISDNTQEKSENQDSEKINEKKRKKKKKEDRENFNIHKHKSKNEDIQDTNIPGYQNNGMNDNYGEKNLVTQQMAINEELLESEKWISGNIQKKSENQNSEKINEKKRKKMKKKDRENCNIYKHKSKIDDTQDTNISGYQNNGMNDNYENKNLVTQQMAINEESELSELSESENLHRNQISDNMKEKSEIQDSEKIDGKKQKKMKKKDKQNFEIHKHKSKKEDIQHTNISDYQTNDTNDNSRDKNLVTQQMAINEELSESEKWNYGNVKKKFKDQDSKKIDGKKRKEMKKKDRDNFNIHKHKSKNEDTQNTNIFDYKNKSMNDNSMNKSLVDTSYCSDATYLAQQMAIDDELSDSEKLKLYNLRVQLKCEALPQHEIETRAGSHMPTREQINLFEQIAPLIRGSYINHEDQIIVSNWKSFCKIHDWNVEKTKPFLRLRVGSKVYIRNAVERRKFVQFLADGLPNRTLYSVYHRFRNLYGKTEQRRYKPDEDKMIIDHLENNPTLDEKRKYSDLAKVLHRTRNSIWRRYKVLKKKKNKELS